MPMSPLVERFFFAVFESLPRQGPGNRASAERALRLCGALPPGPLVVDLGCGVGAQTLQLAELLPDARIVAVDLHGPNVARLRAAVAERGLEGRVTPIEGDMTGLALLPGSVDLVWSEGALYNLGLARAMSLCAGLLRPGGHLAFTDAVWRVEDPPPDARAIFAEEYPGMGGVPELLATVAAAGFEVLGHFPLPDEAWWDDFYTPMERRIAALRAEHRDDPEAQAALDQLAEEPATQRRLGHTWAYEFVVARRR